MADTKVHFLIQTGMGVYSVRFCAQSRLCQRFNSKTIRSALPNRSRRFVGMHGSWRQLCSSARDLRNLRGCVCQGRAGSLPMRSPVMVCGVYKNLVAGSIWSGSSGCCRSVTVEVKRETEGSRRCDCRPVCLPLLSPPNLPGLPAAAAIGAKLTDYGSAVGITLIYSISR